MSGMDEYEISFALGGLTLPPPNPRHPVKHQPFVIELAQGAPNMALGIRQPLRWAAGVHQCQETPKISNDQFIAKRRLSEELSSLLINGRRTPLLKALTINPQVLTFTGSSEPKHEIWLCEGRLLSYHS